MGSKTLITDPAGAAKLDTADRDGNLVAVVEDLSVATIESAAVRGVSDMLSPMVQGRL